MASSCSSFTFEALQQKPFSSITLCKYPSTLSTFKFHYSSNFHTFSPTKHTCQSSPVVQIRENNTNPISAKTTILKPVKESGSGLVSLGSKDGNLERNFGETLLSSSADNDNRSEKRFRNDRFVKKDLGYRKMREKGSEGFGYISVKSLESESSLKKNVEKNGEKKGRKGSKRSNVDKNLPEVHLRVSLDMCSKRGDVMGAIELFDSALREGIAMGQHHYGVLLYLCSSAAVGVVRPAKSGSGARTLNADISDDGERNCGTESSLDSSFNEKEIITNLSNGLNSSDLKDVSGSREDNEIWVSEDVKKYALERGFEIYEKMCLDKVPMNEAILTSIARMGMSMDNGDMAFEMVKQMKPLGINPRLRSYGPALSVFCNSGDIDKAFLVEEHMLEHGVYPEEPELEALLKVSVEAGRGDKVYYLLHKLRASVRKVSPSTANLIVKWFESTSASRVGKIKWDRRLIKEAIGNGGGGWHGQGWLGRGKWTVSHTTVGTDGLCKCCGEKLATIDLDPIETENFAESVASIASKREKNSSFQKFRKWLDYYGPFEAVVDAANVGLYSQNRFVPSKVNAVVNGMRQMLPTKKWPLIVLHNRRTNGRKMDEPVNRALIEKWKNADALYATPTGSNDDWYWLYAAIKFKCLLVTNDEMRDHTFQLLGNDFFPKWKERHQVHFSFSNGGPAFHMPPPCAVVIQESENGHWHVPIASEHEYEAKRPWLCVTRAKSRVSPQDSPTRPEESQSFHHDKKHQGQQLPEQKSR